MSRVKRGFAPLRTSRETWISSTFGMADSNGGSVADRVAGRLSKLLGPHTARVAVKVFSQKALGRGPESLTVADLPALTAALKPMLNTLVGRDMSEVVVKNILREFGL